MFSLLLITYTNSCIPVKCVFVCMLVCVNICVCVSLCICVWVVYLYICIYIYIYICMCVAICFTRSIYYYAIDYPQSCLIHKLYYKNHHIHSHVLTYTQTHTAFPHPQRMSPPTWWLSIHTCRTIWTSPISRE